MLAQIAGKPIGQRSLLEGEPAWTPNAVEHLDDLRNRRFATVSLDEPTGSRHHGHLRKTTMGIERNEMFARLRHAGDSCWAIGTLNILNVTLQVPRLPISSLAPLPVWAAIRRCNN